MEFPIVHFVIVFCCRPALPHNILRLLADVGAHAGQEAPPRDIEDGINMQ